MKTCHTGNMTTHVGTPGARVRGLAAERGLRQEDIAEHLGVSRHLIGKRYRGDGDFSASQLARLSELFGVPVGALFGEVSQ
jgi:transcriptional regulator with XRE-family HTH domain